MAFGGLGIGAALAYWLDPNSGARRRALAKQKAYHLGRVAARTARATARDLEHRGKGLWSELRARLQSRTVRMRGELEDDDIVCERVRARLGRLTAHARAIEVHVRDGRAELKGPILKSELGQVLAGIARVRGVRAIDNDLAVHSSESQMPLH